MLRNKLAVNAPKPSAKYVVGNEAELSARKTDSISREKQSIRKELEGISEHTKTSEKKEEGIQDSDNVLKQNKQKQSKGSTAGELIQGNAFGEDILRLGGKNLSTDYELADFLEENNVRALTEYKYAQLTRQTVAQARDELRTLDVADESRIVRWTQANLDHRLIQIRNAITTAANGQPYFLKVADGLHWITTALIPDTSTPGTIKLVYMNSAYGEGAEQYIRCKLTGLNFMMKLIKLIEETDNPVAAGQKLEVEATTLYFNPTQQLSNNCGVMIAFYIAALATYWKTQNGANIDLAQFGNWAKDLPLSKILSLSDITKRTELFVQYVRDKFASIRTLESEDSELEDTEGEDLDADATVLQIKLVKQENIQTLVDKLGKIEKERLGGISKSLPSDIMTKISKLSSVSQGMVIDVIEQSRAITGENVGKDYTVAELTDAYKLVLAADEKQRKDKGLGKESGGAGSSGGRQPNGEKRGSNDNEHSDDLSKFSDSQVDLRLSAYTKPLTAEGLRKSFHGNLYQLGLLTLAAYRASSKGKAFYLVSEAAQFEKFDDLVIDYGDNITFLQAKHSSKGDGDVYSEGDFCAPPTTENDASLAKYFDSWLKLRSGDYAKTEAGKLKVSRYIFFTNRGVKNNDRFLEDYAVKEDEFLFDGLNTKTVRFKAGATRAKFIDSIRAFSDKVNEDKPDINDIDLDELEEEFEKAVTYLKKKLPEWDVDEPKKTKGSKKKIQAKEIAIDNRSQLPKKVMALIKLALEHKDFGQALTQHMEEDTVALMEKHKANIKVAIDNPIAVLAKVMQKEIDEFLDLFIIKIEQPGHADLLQVILKELKLDIRIAPLEFYSALNGFMLDWFSKRHECLIKSPAIGEFIQAEIGDLHRFYLLGNTKLFEEEYTEFPVSLDGLEIQSLYDFLDPKSTNFVAMVSGVGVKPRVYRTVEQLEDLHDAEWAFLEITSSYLSQLPDILKGSSTRFLIIDCRNKGIAKEELAQLIKPIVDATVSNKKKLVLIIEKAHKDALKPASSSAVSIKDLPKPIQIKVKELTNDKLKNAYSEHSEKFLSLKGKQHKLVDILEDSESGVNQVMRDLDLLPEVLNALVPDRTKVQSGLPYNIYEPNDVVEGVPYFDLGTLVGSVQVELFVINGIDSINLIDHFNMLFNKEDKDGKKIERFVTKPTSTDNPDVRYRLIRNISDITKCKEKLIYVTKPKKVENLPQGLRHISLVIADKENYQVIIEANPMNVALPNPFGYDFTKNKSSDDLRGSILTSSHFSILSAPAGLGKSAFCLDRRDHWIQNESSTEPAWVVRISLPKLYFISETPDFLSAFLNWQRWQLKVLELDARRENQVVLLLDSLDEIKEDSQIPRLNHWLSTIPSTVSVLMTTRPYAAHKVLLPQERSLGRYITLKKYTPEQHKRYVTKYVKAIVRKAEGEDNTLPVQEEEALDEMSTMAYEKLTKVISKQAMSLLGIPLESYIFCETLEPHILVELRAGRKLSLDGMFGGEDMLSTAMLYQHFILAKLQLFLQKHMQMPLETTLRFPERVYSFTASYNDVLMAFAFRQAFKLKYSFISESLARTYYTERMITEELPDTGLVAVSKKDNEFQLNFNHETYQEYLAATFLIRGILLEDTLSQFVSQVVIDARYNPQYRMILSMAAQLSVIGSPLIPAFNKDNISHIIVFWKVLSEKGDVLGAASSGLFLDCLREVSQEQKLKLKEGMESKDWAMQLISAIDDKSSDVDSDEDLTENQNAELPVLAEQATGKINKKIKIDRESIKGILRNKAVVVERTKALLAEVESEVIASLFEEIIGNDDKLNSYWDIDGGFRAMALLGNSFRAVHAQYFVRKVNGDASWRAGPALTAITSLYNQNLQENTQVACFDVISCLMLHPAHVAQNQLNVLLKKSSQALLKALVVQLITELSTIQVDHALLRKPFEELFEGAIKSFRSILWIAIKLSYAAIITEDHREIRLIGQETISIILEDDIINDFFREIQKSIFLKLEKIKNKAEILIANDLWQDFIDASSSEKFKKQVLAIVLSDKEKFDKYFDDLLKSNPIPKLEEKVRVIVLADKEKLDKYINAMWPDDGSAVCALFKDFNEDELITEILVAKLTIETKTTKATERGGYYGPWWSLWGGIEAVGYTGKYFNNELAQYLILRSGYWPDNCVKAVTALKMLHDALQGSEHDGHYGAAVEAYNTCIAHFQFNGKGLVAIQVDGVHDEATENDTIVMYVKDIIYDNVLLNDELGRRLLLHAHKNYGIKAVDLLLELGRDQDIANELLEAVAGQGQESILNALLGINTAQSPSIVSYIPSSINGDFGKMVPLINPNGINNIDVAKPEPIILELQEESALSFNQGYGLFATFVHTLTDKITNIFSNGLVNIGNTITNAVMKNNYLKHKLLNYVYQNELSAINTVINKPYIQLSDGLAVQSLLQKHPLEWTRQDFKKIKLVVHPDKGGEAEDFRTVNAFEEHVGDKDQMYQNLLPKLLPNIQTVVHKSNIGFKVLDMVVDSSRLIYEPTLTNAKKVALDSTYLYSMYYGVNSYSSIISTVDVLQLAYQEEYIQALKQAATTIGYMALPSLLVYTAIPHLGLAYGIGMATYTAYSAITNSYSFYLERTSDTKSILRSTMAYRDLAQTLSASSLQQLYDFVIITKGYELQLNNIAFTAEKEALKSKLVEEKGEFGQKLYDYIYKSSIEEKYNLLNQVLQGSITEEETENLKAKHIKITSDKQSYEHCIEIRDIGNGKSISNDESNIAEHYYCYSDEKEILDHIVVGSNNIQIIEHLF